MIRYRLHLSILLIFSHKILLILLDYKLLLIHFLIIKLDNMETNLNSHLCLPKENNNYHHHTNLIAIILMDLTQVELLEDKEADSICFQEQKNQTRHNQLQIVMTLNNQYKFKHLNHWPAWKIFIVLFSKISKNLNKYLNNNHYLRMHQKE